MVEKCSPVKNEATLTASIGKQPQVNLITYY